MTTTAINPTPLPDVSLPVGTHLLSDWQDYDDGYRLVWGDGRRVEGTDISLVACAAQLPDGSIDLAGNAADEAAQVMIDQLRDGRVYDCLQVSLGGARNLIQALTAIVNEVDGWATR